MLETTIPYESLYQFCQQVFEKMGCSPKDAVTATKVLLAADVRGIDSHGVARLSGYLRLWKAGRIKANNVPTIIHQTPSTATLDGDAGLGLTVAVHAMEIAIEKARNVGSGWVAVQNSNHFGIAGYHAMMALEHDMIGFAMTNASALVAPTFSTEKMLGTNPIAVAIPAGKRPAFVADFATTTAANGKLEILQRKNAAMPTGWAQTAEGDATTDAHILKQNGALLPLGTDREHGSHKGYALGSIVDILSAVLSGASYGPWAPPFPAYVPMPQNMPGKGLGHFVGAMRINAFRPAEEFKQHMDHWIDRFKAAQPIDPKVPVLVPGEPEAATAVERMKTGIPLVPTVVADLRTIGEEFSIDFPG
ncbi:MAG: Ldh family oxidoreductase [Bacteroidetes bacterium]|nr:MAG: Ldh family oxidoreductase [Bacteroidota bacterium]